MRSSLSGNGPANTIEITPELRLSESLTTRVRRMAGYVPAFSCRYPGLETFQSCTQGQTIHDGILLAMPNGTTRARALLILGSSYYGN
jgi:hypothetical protein